MENTARRKRRDTLQNIAIVLLSLSAVLLFAQSQISNLSSGSGLRQLVGGNIAADRPAAIQLTDLSAPVRVAVTGAYDRYGQLSLATDSEDFADLGILLKGALGSVDALAPCQASEFRAALAVTSVYYDFLSPLPLPVLAGLVGGDETGEGVSVRYLVLSAGQGDSARLYTWDGGEEYLACDIPITAGELETVVNGCEFGGVSFAFDDLALNDAYGAIAPCSLLPSELPALPVLSAASPLSDTDWLLSALGFAPNTKNWYLESTGTKVVLEGDRSLRIRTDGTVLVQGGSEPLLEIDAAGEVPTLREAAVGSAALLEQLLGDLSGSAALYLQSVTRTGEATVLRFGYHVNGVPVRFADGGEAATVALSGPSVTGLTLRFRQYTLAGGDSLLLPLRQALAIAATHPGAELSLGYTDDGGNTVSAGWLAE